LFENPIKHISIQIMDGITLTDQSECIVVTTKTAMEGKDEVFGRRIVSGPCHFIPSVNETVKMMHWTSTAGVLDATDNVGSVIKKETRTKMTTSPFMFRTRVGLTTTDGFRFKIELHVLLRIRDVTAAASTDPIGQVWRALRTDMIAVGAQCPSAMEIDSLQLKSLGQAGRLPGTTAAASATGVEFMGLTIGEVERPKELVMAEATMIGAKAKHEAAMELAKRSAELDRQKAAAQLTGADQSKQVLDADFAVEAQRARLQHELKSADQQRKLALEANARDSKLQTTRQENQVFLEFLGKLKEFDVDLTKYLTTVAPGGNIKAAPKQCAAGRLSDGSCNQHEDDRTSSKDTPASV